MTVPGFAESVRSIPPYPFARMEEAIQERRRKGQKVIAFNIGDPDVPTPGYVVEAMASALRDGEYQGYSSADGEPWFKQAVADWYRKRFGVDLDPSTEVCALMGSKEGLANISRAFVNPGETVLCPDPAYPVYANGGTLLIGGKPDFYPASQKISGHLDRSRLRGARLVYVNYPHNPTGLVADEADLRKVVDDARGSECLICYDNAYSELTFGGYRAPSILQLDREKDVSIELHSCSKTFAMTGYRIGFAVGNSKAISGLKKVKSQIDSGPPKFVQHAARVALQGYAGQDPPKEVREISRTYEDRLGLFVRGLGELGMQAEMPKGTFYLWQRVPGTSEDFTEKLLDMGIMVSPGSAFGDGGEGYVRWSLTQPADVIEEALELMRKGLG